MTPKGVEHRVTRSASGGAVGVKIPMTPKGVEHHVDVRVYDGCVHRGEDSYDAERR